jgi:hypothetical protein
MMKRWSRLVDERKKGVKGGLSRIRRVWIIEREEEKKKKMERKRNELRLEWKVRVLRKRRMIGKEKSEEKKSEDLRKRGK